MLRYLYCKLQINSWIILFSHVRRKRIGTLADEKWDGRIPSFRTREEKQDLEQFVSEIASQCESPAVSFTREGIKEHVKDYFYQQKRQRRLVSEALLLFLVYFCIWYLDINEIHLTTPISLSKATRKQKLEKDKWLIVFWYYDTSYSLSR